MARKAGRQRVHWEPEEWEASTTSPLIPMEGAVGGGEVRAVRGPPWLPRASGLRSEWADPGGARRRQGWPSEAPPLGGKALHWGGFGWGAAEEGSRSPWRGPREVTWAVGLGEEA